MPKTTIRLLERSIGTDYVVERLLRPFRGRSVNQKALLVHVDLTPAVWSFCVIHLVHILFFKMSFGVHESTTWQIHKGIEEFCFNLLVLGSIQNSRGYVWKKDPNHLYMIEVTLGDHLQKVKRKFLKFLNFITKLFLLLKICCHISTFGIILKIAAYKLWSVFVCHIKAVFSL